MNSNNERSEMLSEQFVRDRGWSPADIRDHLEPPDCSGYNARNPRAPLRLFRLDRVVAAEAEAWWSQGPHRARKISNAKKAKLKRSLLNSGAANVPAQEVSDDQGQCQGQTGVMPDWPSDLLSLKTA